MMKCGSIIEWVIFLIRSISFQNKEDYYYRGIVSEKQGNSYKITFDEAPSWLDSPYILASRTHLRLLQTPWHDDLEEDSELVSFSENVGSQDNSPIEQSKEIETVLD